MHILHLEDSPHDAELTREMLRTCWPDCEITIANNREEFERAVTRGDFDLVLSDFSMPSYNGLNALAFTRSHTPDKPFIYLSGTIGEERAIAALKAGATDYVVKDRPARLIPAISAALQQAEQAQARKLAEEKIHEQASLLDKAREAIFVIDAEGRVTYWNASAARLYGWSAEEAAGQVLRELLYAEDVVRFNAAYGLAMASAEWRGELSPRSRGGAPVLVESSWTLVHDRIGEARSILIVETDITQKKKLENQMQQSQRLEMLGLLVGGIAHDLNNMLAPIITSASILRDGMSKEEDRELLEILDLSAHHGVDLVRQLLAFARGSNEKHSEVAVDSLVGSVWKLLQRAMPEHIDIRTSLEGKVRPVEADATQLRQVILNLCINARDAMPEGGVIEIRAKNEEVAPTFRSIQGEVRAGNYVRISVADTGTGIPPEIVHKIFDPFFTTKQVGKGTGLGLSNVVGIIKSHGGFLDLESTPGKGTTFHVYLPAFMAGTAGQSESSATRRFIQGKEERVLIIEDDEDVRMVLNVILDSRGYNVTLTSSKHEARAQLQHDPDSFDLVMMDLDMPTLNGLEVAQLVRDYQATAKLIVFGSAPNEPAELKALADIEYLRKPITVEVLLGTLRSSFESTPTGGDDQATEGHAGAA